MGIMVYALLWVMQDLYYQPQDPDVQSLLGCLVQDWVLLKGCSLV